MARDEVKLIAKVQPKACAKKRSIFDQDNHHVATESDLSYRRQVQAAPLGQ